MRNRRPTWRRGTVSADMLERRLVLNATANQQALDMFSVLRALFVENQGQWADEWGRFVRRSGARPAWMATTAVWLIPQLGLNGAN